MARVAVERLQSNGYIKRGNIWVHREVLYHSIGDGPHLCAQCRTPVTWGAPMSANALICDHIDWDRTNNDPANLQPLCPPCSSRRRQKLVDYGDLLDD